MSVHSPLEQDARLHVDAVLQAAREQAWPWSSTRTGRGWLEPGDVLDTRSLEELSTWMTKENG